MDQPLILLLETATSRCSVGLSRGPRLLLQVDAEAPFSHAAQITLLIQRCLEATGQSLSRLDAVAVSSGPGSYTALRVGASTAKGLCYTLQKPLLGIPTLYSLAYGSRQSVGAVPGSFAPMIDARRQDVYWQWYDEELRPIGPLEMRTLGPDMLESRPGKVFLSGNGADKAEELLGEQVENLGIYNEASLLAGPAFEAFTAGHFEDVAYFVPQYVTPPNITKPKKTW